MTKHIVIWDFIRKVLCLKELAARSELNKDVTFRCRTIGILQSVNGRFYLTELTTPVYRSETSIQLSAAYLKSPPPSTVIPYPVQVFGTVQWCKKPVLVAKFIQTLNATMALRMKDAVTSITDTHLATHSDDEHFEREAKI
ncbi:uncharacterized protein LOC113522978 isoform X2 [Galleria mellonella]|uniref:Uncharacterized protein LOC113522978 isoform X2 n=1 Tax=Galleria mellonella TaxID=7137 RepID=A0ABM3N5K8_GALME|nr:uncharacterized protein LOC113522978 isoform X2 [Galleria mellonella]